MKKLMQTAPTTHEDALHARGLRYVAGVDEAGRGPLAGPVVAAAVVFAPGVVIEGVRDSKKIAERQRSALAQEIRARALAVGIALVDAAEIDRVNILQATMNAMAAAVLDAQAHLGAGVDYALVDGNRLPPLPCAGAAIVKGDAHSHAIAAASIIAKVTRDEWMRAWDAQYPQYGFALHKGYGTKAHLAAIRAYGACAVHRKTFRGVR